MKRGEDFKMVIFVIKKFVSMHNLTGNSLVLFYLSVFGKKDGKFYLSTFLKLLNDVKTIFVPIDWKFGIYIVHTCMTHILYVC